MNFCTSASNTGGWGGRNLGQCCCLSAVSRVSCSLASRRHGRVHRGLCNALRHRPRRGQSERGFAAACARSATPPDQSEPCSLRVYTQRHMARLRCPCEPDPGGINSVVVSKKRRSGALALLTPFHNTVTRM